MPDVFGAPTSAAKRLYKTAVDYLLPVTHYNNNNDTGKALRAAHFKSCVAHVRLP